MVTGDPIVGSTAINIMDVLYKNHCKSGLDCRFGENPPKVRRTPFRLDPVMFTIQWLKSVTSVSITVKILMLHSIIKITFKI